MNHPLPFYPMLDSSSLAADLLAMADRDQRVRAELVADGTLFDGYHPRMRAVHNDHADRLASILDTLPWPSPGIVGDDAAAAAWLVAMHAIDRPPFMLRCLEAMTTAPDVARRHIAMLDDAIRFHAGIPQRYGTIVDWFDIDGTLQLGPGPIEAPEDLDARRATMGLESMAERMERGRQTATTEGQRPPADHTAREASRQAWRHDVGWDRLVIPSGG